MVREFSEIETIGRAASAAQSQRSNASSPCGGPADEIGEAG